MPGVLRRISEAETAVVMSQKVTLKLPPPQLTELDLQSMTKMGETPVTLINNEATNELLETNEPEVMLDTNMSREEGSVQAEAYQAYLRSTNTNPLMGGPSHE